MQSFIVRRSDLHKESDSKVSLSKEKDNYAFTMVFTLTKRGILIVHVSLIALLLNRHDWVLI